MWHKAPCSSRDYSGVRESGPRKIDEDGDDDGDVDEDDHRGDISPPDGSLWHPAEGGHHHRRPWRRIPKGPSSP